MVIASDGVTEKDEFTPQFPALRQLHSFGIPSEGGAPAILLSATPNAANVEAAPVPAILSFPTTAEVIANGESVTSAWESENGTWVTFHTSSSQTTPVEASGSTILGPILNQTVILRVWNKFAETQEVINILVESSANALTALPATIATGGQSVLRWDTEGSGEALDLDGFIVNHHPVFSEVWPGDHSAVGQVKNPEQIEA